MSNRHRRTFLMQIAAAGAIVTAVRARAENAGPKVEESDPQAIALGYRQETAKVDAKKFPKHDASQSCATCQLFQGKPTDAAGGCPLFAGKQVASTGWCSAWARKAG